MIETGDPLSSSNQLSLNQLSLNQLSLNQLPSSPLAIARLAGDRLAFNDQANDDIQNTANGRQTLQYIARCALSAGDVLVVEDLQANIYEFPGLLGLAPDWETSPLDVEAKELVSACLIAHVNAYGVEVSISVRAANLLAASASEQSAYSVYEGTFFGQIFTGYDQPMKIYSCQGDRSELARAQSMARTRRVCTDTTPDCQVTVVGLCRDVCSLHTDDHGWQDCRVEQPSGSVEYYMNTISVFLLADDPSGANRECGSGQQCTLSTSTKQRALLDSAESSTSMLTCGNKSQCIIHAADASAVSVIAAKESVAQVDCMGADICAATCQDGAACDIDCAGAGTCSDIQCTGGSGCLLHCADTLSCGFSSCPDGALACSNDIIVCGRECP